MKKQAILLGAMLLPFLTLAATYVVTNVNDSSAGSLRQAILDANANPGLDYIHFNIPGAGPHIISPLTPLPYTEGPVVLDAYTQPGASPAGVSALAVIKIELNGSLIAAPQDQTYCGICLQSDATVRGFAIHDFGSGILMVGSGNSIRGNYIGLVAGGSAAPGNLTDGLVVNGSSNTIGGTTAADRNVISGHPEEGIVLFPYTSGNVVRGNYLGTNANGNSLLPNINNNIAVSGDNNTMEGNVLGGGGHGIFIVRWNSDTPPPAFNLVQNNRIGSGPGRASAIPNCHGITIYEANNNSIIGNIIAENTCDGINIYSPNSTGNRISQNIFFGNGGLAIDLSGDGVTPNDLADIDAGPNNLLNFPVITSAKTTPDNLKVKGEIDAPNPSSITVELYANPSGRFPGVDPSGYGEGRLYLGSAAVTPNGKFTATLPPVVSGTWITAIAIDGSNNTSEFAANVAATTQGSLALLADLNLSMETFPNPSQSSVFFSYRLPGAAQVRLAVYHAGGQEAAVLVNEFQEAGLYRVEFRGEGLPAGTYSYRLETGEGVQSGKLVLLRR